MANKVVIITGASSGFGYLSALEAGRRGYQVVVTARRAERLEELVGKVEQQGGEILAIAGDINDDAHQQEVIDRTLERFGRIDVLVNNAGLPLDTSFREASLADIRRQWDTNTTSLIILSKRALPELMRTKGTIINISSSISRFSVPGWGLYASTKMAASSVSDALRRELAPFGVAVCTVEPGPYNTEFGQRAGQPADQPFGFDPQVVANAIVSLFERPRRLVVRPIWMRPIIAIGGTVVHALPDIVDLVFLLAARLRQRRQGTKTNQKTGKAA